MSEEYQYVWDVARNISLERQNNNERAFSSTSESSEDETCLILKVSVTGMAF